MDEAYDGRQVVGMDLHRRRSVLVRMSMDGRKLETVRIGNSPGALRAVLARCGERPLVVLEATYGWYWAADVLAGAGAEVRLAHPLGVRAFSYRRVKNDERDAADLADLLRAGLLPQAWIAPPEVRALREVVRYRHKLVGQRTSCKDQVHAVPDQLPQLADLGRRDPGLGQPAHPQQVRQIRRVALVVLHPTQREHLHPQRVRQMHRRAQLGEGVRGPVPAIGRLEDDVGVLAGARHHRLQVLRVIGDPHRLQLLAAIGHPYQHRPAPVQVHPHDLMSHVLFAHRGLLKPLT